MPENHDHSRFIYNSYYYDGHRLDPSDLDLAAYIDARIAANGGGGSSYLVYDSFGDFPATGETGKVYLSSDDGYTYKWSGSAYVGVEIGYYKDSFNAFSIADEGDSGITSDFYTLNNVNQESGSSISAVNETKYFIEPDFESEFYKEAAAFYNQVTSTSPAVRMIVRGNNQEITMQLLSMPSQSHIFSITIDRDTGYKFSNVPEYADNAAAVSGGLTVGCIYRTAGDLKIVTA